jgi:predicted site-specific integrase-resolvase
MLTIKQIAATLGVATSTIHRWLNDGIIAGEQLTPGALAMPPMICARASQKMYPRLM